MITRQNLHAVINSLDKNTKKRILKNNRKEYCVIKLDVFNSGSIATANLTNDLARYNGVSLEGNCILSAYEVQDIINSNRD